MRSLFTLVLVIAFFTSARAQLSRGAMLWSGGMELASQSNPNLLRFSLFPEAHYFLTDHFTVGGRFNLGATFEKGVQLLIVDPQIRFYFPSRNDRSNFFAFTHSELFFPVDEELGLDNQVRLFLGGGWQARLNPNVALETKLFAIYQENPGNPEAPFFSRPTFGLETGLLLFLNAYEEPNFQSRIGKGSWLIGGNNLKVNYLADGLNRQFSFSMTPRIGYFFSDMFMAGIGLPFDYQFTEIGVSFGFTDRIQSQIVGLSPFFRFYPKMSNSRVRPFLNAEVNYLRTRLDDRINFGLNFVPRNRYNFTLSGGINHFLTPTTALEAAAFYNWDASQDITRGGIQLGFQFFLARESE
ncbi:hypothetical protein [Flavilitoribacter nigricans]|uniref:Outer membrane beta-barrel protein n=1 Tax=Flavilitoribacter nigricans (strain ATCC 23147 / DSM 23189 / NBRC 102662 / NCIMB 1420 / SS-2) TaxID=1122177 RepID=A0A2D0MYX2_FLAN2|nr:hypothetical protein [Flavilitoribacter nigricans]PHN01328.1 hypothetical protein CRP01_37855 [Flavilitoribacter nigricans DSM 23189 = NBRC 102662]